MSSTVVHTIGRLLTNDPDLGRGPTGELSGAWVVIVGSEVVEVGTGPPPAADTGIDVGGRCVMPGFVDSHSHLVFAGDRSAEFAARMAGEAYSAGGIATTVAATRQATDDELRSRAAQLVAEARRSGTTTIEIKSGYGLTSDHEQRLLEIAGELSDETTFLGAHVVPGRVPRAGGRLRRPGLWRDARRAAPRTRAGSTPSARRARSRQNSAVPSSTPGAGPGWGCACTPTSSVPVTASDSGSSSDAPPWTTARISPIETSRHWPASSTVATLLPATDFSTRQPYPDARRLLDAGVTVALAVNCNPGSSYTTSMPFCIALAVRDLGMTPDEAILAATVGGARALRRDDIGRLSPGRRADLLVLDASSPIDFVYRPGVPIVSLTMVGGTVVHRTAGD